jgi:short subunit dehydrogenase-like uncharacterized protein
MVNREFDIVVFGAASFVGKILCEYLANEHREANLSWAMAGRSQSKLDDLKKSLGQNAESIPCLIADSHDEASLQSMCSSAEVIISTVGPYALYGDLLVKICAHSGTDYCDLTGEPQWIRRMITKYEAAAQESGARIVNSCGFDSIPSDLGVQVLQRAALKNFGSYCSEVKMRVVKMKGGASGGTIASGLNVYKEAARDPALREELKDWYSLCPQDHGFNEKQKNVRVEYEADFDSWAGPFIMASINTRIVLRSNSLVDGFYSASFRYDEAMLTGDGKKGEKVAKRLARGTGWGMVAMTIPPVRWFVSKFFLPKPGEGPSPEQQLDGFYELSFVGRTDKGDRITATVKGDRDPGYGSTAKMLAQAGISLCRDVDKSEVGGGFWTPATVFSEKLIERLENYAGMSFQVLVDTEEV